MKKTYHDTDNYTDDVDEVIREGVRTSHPRQYVGKKINGTYAGGQRQSEKCKSVVEYGTKNPTD